jgi:hypothetical protein
MFQSIDSRVHLTQIEKCEVVLQLGKPLSGDPVLSYRFTQILTGFAYSGRRPNTIKLEGPNSKTWQTVEEGRRRKRRK